MNAMNKTLSRTPKPQPFRSFTKTETNRVVRLLEHVGRLKERQRTYQVEHRKKFKGLIKNILDIPRQLAACPSGEAVLKSKLGGSAPNLNSKDYWVYFKSPPESWQCRCGSEGWFVIDHDTLKSKEFIIIKIN
ncbi:MAG: hypothetical protein ACKOAD_04675 [Gammaproteobacteria bacterium]